MAIIDIPTGNLPYEVVDELPSVGEENHIYGVPIEGMEEYGIYTDYRWHNGEWEQVDLSANIFGFLFADYQESVQETVAEMEQTIAEQNALIEELEHEVFPASAVTFKMQISSEYETSMNLFDSDGQEVLGSGIYTEIWTDHNLSYDDNLKRGTYYLRNTTANLILADAFGNEVPLRFMGNSPVEVGSVIVTQIAPPKKGGKK